MSWVAFDRATRMAAMIGDMNAARRWRAVADEVHNEVMCNAFDAQLGTFVQYYGAKHVDASLLQIPLVGFLAADDPRMRGTVAMIERQLLHHGLVQRYETEPAVDGLPPGEGAFLACSFWLADNFALQGRTTEAHALFNRLLTLRNDVGLLPEEYDPKSLRMLGNFPQAFSHVGLINTAFRVAQNVVEPRRQTQQADVADLALAS